MAKRDKEFEARMQGMIIEHDAEVRADAISEFRDKICEKYTEEESKGNYKQYCVNIKQDIADIAEQMKGGVDHEIN